MNQDHSRGESKPTPFAQLGEFSKLPPELRFQIWNYFFDDFYKNGSPHGLSILSCSRSLNKETSYILYEHRVLTLTIKMRCSEEGIPEFSAFVKTKKRGKKKLGSKYMKLSCLDDVLRLVQNFPSWRFQKCGPRILISYLYSLFPSEELELWNCVLRVVETLKLIPNGKNITFNTYYPWPKHPEDTQELTQSGVLKEWFNERFPDQPVPFRSCQRPDILDHDYPPGPYLLLPVYHYSILQAMYSAERKQNEQDKLEVDL